MSGWDDVIRRIDDDARFRRRMVVDAVQALRELGLSFPEADRARLVEYADGVMRSHHERVDSARPDPGREAEQDRLRELPMPDLPEDYHGIHGEGPLDTVRPRLPIPTSGSVTNPFPVGPEEIHFPVPGAPGGDDGVSPRDFLPRRQQPERHPELDQAIDRAVHPAQALDPRLVHDPLDGLHGPLSRSRVDGFATAIAHVRDQTTGGDLLPAVILLFTALGDTLYRDPGHDHALVGERGEWAHLHEYANVPARFTAARDRLVTAAEEVHDALGLWVGHPVPLETAHQFGQVLVHGSQEARAQLAHLTEHAVRDYTETVSALAGAANDSAAIAAGVTTVLERADRLFHDSDASMNADVAAEAAAWLTVGTAAGDGADLDTARDQVVNAAHEFTHALDEHLDHLVDDATRARLLQPLVHAATLAREHLQH